MNRFWNKIWPRGRRKSPDSPSTPGATKTGAEEQDSLRAALDTLGELAHDPRLPAQVRQSLSEEFAQIQRLSDKLANQQIHIAAFGRVGVGKSSLLNSLLQRPAFSTSALHGETTGSDSARLFASNDDHAEVWVIDTPGLDEIDGQQREAIAFEVAGECDLVLYVVDADLTRVEREAIELLARQGKPIVLVLNKADRLQDSETEQLLARLGEATSGLVARENIVTAAAAPRALPVVNSRGEFTGAEHQPEADNSALMARLGEILAREGNLLAAVNAGLFTGELQERMQRRIMATRARIAERLVRGYAAAKALSVGANPIPVADLLAAASLDVALVIHLSRVYGLPLSWHQAGRLVTTIFGQLAALMGAIWTIHLVSSTLKIGTLGLSTLLTGGAQGLMAWYATYLVGKAAEQYLIAGGSWGSDGPRRTVKRLLSEIDRESILAQAREDLRRRLHS